MDVIFRGVLGNGITSLILDIPVIYIIILSKPSPNPAWGALPYLLNVKDNEYAKLFFPSCIPSPVYTSNTVLLASSEPPAFFIELSISADVTLLSINIAILMKEK